MHDLNNLSLRSKAIGLVLCLTLINVLCYITAIIIPSLFIIHEAMSCHLPSLRVIWVFYALLLLVIMSIVLTLLGGLITLVHMLLCPVMQHLCRACFIASVRPMFEYAHQLRSPYTIELISRVERVQRLWMKCSEANMP